MDEWLEDQWYQYDSRYCPGWSCDFAPMAKLVVWNIGATLLINRAAKDLLQADRVQLAYRKGGSFRLIPSEGSGLKVARYGATKGKGNVWRICAVGFVKRYQIPWRHGTELLLFRNGQCLQGHLQDGVETGDA